MPLLRPGQLVVVLTAFGGLVTVGCADDSGGTGAATGSGDTAGTGDDGETSSGDDGTTGSDGGTTGTSTGPEAIPQEEYAQALAEAYCAMLEPCCAPEGMLRDDCIEAHRTDAQQILDGLTEAQRYDAQQAGACIAALVAAPEDCAVPPTDWIGTIRLACAKVVRGTIPPGEPCNGPQECEPPEDSLGNTTTGFAGCSEYGGETSRRCRRFNPTTEVGHECETGFEGDAVEVYVCAGDLKCTDGMCTEPPPLPGLDEACDPAMGCDEGYCDSDSMQCVPFDSAGDACESGTCGLGLRCEPALGTCVTAPPAPTIGFGSLSNRDHCEYP